MRIDSVVIGGGPAGITAALYLRRYRRSVELIDANEGRMRWITKAFNYPGFPHGIAGPELLQAMRLQYEQISTPAVHGRVIGIVRDDEAFLVRLESGDALQTHTLILCTGVKDFEPVIPGVDAVRAAGLLRQCPLCDAYDYSDQHVAVLGDSQHSVAEAIVLRHFTSSITFFSTVRSEFAPELVQQLKEQRIAFIAHSPTLLAVRPDRTVGITTGDGTQYRFQALYSALGTAPRAALAMQLGVHLDQWNNIVVDADCRTSVHNVYAAGDIVGGLKQISIATAQGATAATAVHRHLPSINRSPRAVQ